MKINLTYTTFQKTALTSIVLLSLSSIPLLAQNTPLNPTSNSNVMPCWNTSGDAQTDAQHQQWMAQYGGMMGGSGHHGSGGWGHHSQYGRMYDPNNVTTVRGEVVSVDTFTPRTGMSGGMHLQLRTDNNETMDVHLGPQWYLQNQDIQIEPNDTIEVTGSTVDFNGNTAIIAASLTKGDMMLMLRDPNGVPMWSGWRNYNNQ